VSRILFAWELGGNLGHVMRMRTVARALRERGHDVSLHKEPSPRSSAPDLPREPASYPEILLHYGFADPAALTDGVRRWRSLYAQAAPDLIVFDHAPTALLAARGLGIPRVLLGTGFAFAAACHPHADHPAMAGHSRGASDGERAARARFAPGIRPDAISQLESPSLRIVREPVNVPLSASSAHAAVLHGGHSTTAAMLLGGVPLLVLPEHVEQYLMGRNVAALGAGAALNLSAPAPQLASLLDAVIGDLRYGANAQAFGQKYGIVRAVDVALEIEKLPLLMAAEHS